MVLIFQDAMYFMIVTINLNKIMLKNKTKKQKQVNLKYVNSIQGSGNTIK